MIRGARCVLLALTLVCGLGGLLRAQESDHDCHDQQNDPCDTGQPGICAAGQLKCSAHGLRCERLHDPIGEVCDNGDDDDCDGRTDAEDPDCRCRDRDGDHFAVCGGGCVLDPGDQCGDCDDGRSSVNPSRAENCSNERDDDCDGLTDAEDPSCGPAPCADRDGDHFAVCGGGCVLGPGDQCGDCDDGRSSVNPSRAENCTNERDDDCDGLTDVRDPSCGAPPCPDRDGDGFAVCGGGCVLDGGHQCGDCDDSRAEVHPGRPEVCNGRDDDCDGSTDEGNPGAGGHCDTGDPGICAAGRLVCANGGLQCAPDLSPRPEDCDNGLDDDCNGRADSQDASCREDCGSAVDRDGDEVPDCADNCPGLANGGQQDFDDDGAGDACETGVRVCDADLSGRVDGRDLALLGVVFGRSCGNTGFDPRVDLNRDCRIDGEDLAMLASLFGRAD